MPQNPAERAVYFALLDPAQQATMRHGTPGMSLQQPWEWRTDRESGGKTRLAYESQRAVMTAVTAAAAHCKKRGATADEVWAMFSHRANRLTIHVRDAWTRAFFDRWFDGLQGDRVSSPAEAWREVLDCFAQAVEPRTVNGVTVEPGEATWQVLTVAAGLATNYEFDRVIKRRGLRLGIFEVVPPPRNGLPGRVRLTMSAADVLAKLDAADADHGETERAKAEAKAAARAARRGVRASSESVSATDRRLQTPTLPTDSRGAQRVSVDELRALLDESLPALDSTPAAPQAQTGPVSVAELLTPPAKQHTTPERSYFQHEH